MPGSLATQHGMHDVIGQSVVRRVGSRVLRYIERVNLPTLQAIYDNRCADVRQKWDDAALVMTEWLLWFLQMLGEAVDLAHHALDAVLEKAHFWQRVSGVALNERQVKVINRLLDGFEGKLTSSKWAAIAKSSTDTALRDINELVALGILQRSGAGGRSTSYDLVRQQASRSL